MAEERVLHCWEDGPKRLSEDGLKLIGSTCLLPRDHDGEHEWTPDDEYEVQFAPFPEEP